jgi:hypothetical protein
MQPARMKLHAKEHTNNPVHRPNFRGHALTKGGSSPSTQDSTRDPSPSSLSTKRAKRLVSAPPSDEPSSFGPGSEAGGGMRMPPTSSERWFKDLCRCSLSPSRTMSSVCPSRLPGTLLHTCRVGLASQRVLENLAAGIMLMVFRSFQVGDVVQIAGKRGVVCKITLLATRIDTFSNVRMSIPNKDIFGSIVENYSRNNDQVQGVWFNGVRDGAKNGGGILGRYALPLVLH